MARNIVYAYGRDLSFEVGTGIVSGDLVRIGHLNGVVQADDGVINGRKTGNEPGYASVVIDKGVVKASVVIPSGGLPAGSPVYAVFTGSKVTALNGASATGRAIFGYLKSKQVQGTVTCEVIIGPPSAPIA